MEPESTILPSYQCHKVVKAAKIKEVIDPTEPGNETDGSRILKFDDVPGSITVKQDFVLKHKPEVGGYFVRYEDGYQSISPANAFETGYTKI